MLCDYGMSYYAAKKRKAPNHVRSSGLNCQMENQILEQHKITDFPPLMM